MLILTRADGEEIIIGGIVVVRVIEIKGKQVRLGVEAPRGITVHRAEVEERIRLEQQRGDQPGA